MLVTQRTDWVGRRNKRNREKIQAQSLDTDSNFPDIGPTEAELIAASSEKEACVYKASEDLGNMAMQIAVAWIQSSDPLPINSQEVVVLIDTGGSDTYITTSAASKIGLPLQNPEVCKVTTFNAEEPSCLRKYKVDFDLSLRFPLKTNDKRFEGPSIIPIRGHAVKNITGQDLELPRIPLSESELQMLSNMRRELADLKFNQSRTLKIDMLLGNDYYPQLLMNESFQLEKSQVYLIKTALGWVSAGRITEAAMNTQKNVSALLNIRSSQTAQNRAVLTTLTREQSSKECSVEHLKMISDTPVMHKMKVISTTLPTPKMPILISGIKPQKIQTQSIQKLAQISKLTSCTMQVVTRTVLQPSMVQVVQNLDVMKTHSCLNEYLQQDVQQPLQNIPVQKIPKNIDAKSQRESIVDTEQNSSFIRSLNSSYASLEKASWSCIPERNHSLSSFMTIGHFDSQNTPSNQKGDHSNHRFTKNHKTRKKSKGYASQSCSNQRNTKQQTQTFSLLSSERAERKRKERSNNGCKFKQPSNRITWLKKTYNRRMNLCFMKCTKLKKRFNYSY